MEATPVSLFIDLEEGRRADLEVIARASLAFAAAVKEAAFMIDPSLEVHLELVSGTEGSLKLNQIIKAVKRVTGLDEALASKTLALVVILWFVNHGLDWSFEKVMDWATEGPAK